MSAVSEQTRQYWLDTVLAWAEVRLMPPQFDECKRALLQGPPPAMPLWLAQLVLSDDLACAPGHEHEYQRGWNHAQRTIGRAVSEAVASRR